MDSEVFFRFDTTPSLAPCGGSWYETRCLSRYRHRFCSMSTPSSCIAWVIPGCGLSWRATRAA